MTRRVRFDESPQFLPNQIIDSPSSANADKNLFSLSSEGMKVDIEATFNRHAEFVASAVLAQRRAREAMTHARIVQNNIRNINWEQQKAVRVGAQHPTSNRMRTTGEVSDVKSRENDKSSKPIPNAECLPFYRRQ